MHSNILVVAFGPARVTRAAVERSRALLRPGATITVVPAWRHTGRGLRALESAVVKVAPGSGRRAIEAVLPTLEGRVLLVHDDVLVTPATLARLEHQHDLAGGLVVAHTNEPGTSGYVGPLPPARQATAGVEQLAGDVSASVAQVFRTSCVLGSSGELTALLDTRVTDPWAMVRGWSRPVTIAGGAVVAHDSACATNLPPGRSPDERPLLTATIIAKDEESMLPGCLDSVAGLVDRIVVGDTGSVDRSAEIAASYGAEVVPVPWTDDFAAARNAVLEHCRDSWFVLQVDADERVVCDDADRVRRRLAADVDETTAFRIRIDNVVGALTQNSFEAPRLFRPAEMSYRGALHEIPVSTGGVSRPWALFGGLRLRHLGYSDDVVEARSKKDRNVAIARRQHDEEQSPQSAMNLLRALHAAGESGEEQRHLADLLLESSSLPAIARAHVLTIRATLRADDDPAAAQAEYRQAVHLAPGEDAAARRHAEIAFANGDFTAVVEVAEDRRHHGGSASFRSPEDEASELHHVAMSRLALEEPAAALTAIEALLALRAPLARQAWRDVASMLAVLAPDDALDRLVPLLATDRDGAIVGAAIDIYGAEAAAALTSAACGGGPVPVPALQAGLAAALVAGRSDLARELAGHAGSLPVPVVERLIETASGRGLDEAAGALAESLMAGI